MNSKKITLFLLILISIGFFCLKNFNVSDNRRTFSFWTVQLKAPAGDLIQKNIDKFQKFHPDIKIVWVDIPITEAQKRTMASILGGNPPDLINLNPEYSVSLAQKGVLEYFNKNETEPYNENLVRKLTYEGNIYALPFYATSAVTILNKEKFRTCKIKLKTYDDILKLKTCKNPPIFGIALNEGDSFSKILNKYSVSNSKDLGKVYSLFYELNKSELLLKDTLAINHRESVEKYMSQSAAFIVTGSNFINIIKENAPAVYKNSAIYPQLTGSNGQFDISLMNFVIPKKAKNKELAREFAALLLDEENQLEFAKKTNVLPVNKNALNNPYFKHCGEDLTEKARCISADELNNPLLKDFGAKNKREINEVINHALEILFLKSQKEFSEEQTWNNIKTLMTK